MLYSDFSIDLVLKQMAEIFNKKSTPNRICCVLLEAMEIIQQLRRAAVPPPNDPLTLEELRGLEGESVWVEIIGYIGVRDGNYALVKGFDDEYVYLPSIADPDDLGSIDLYGEDWIAYRRRPEET